MIIIGVDTALRTTGYGVIEADERGGVRALDCGLIRNKPKVPHSECMRCLAGGIRELTAAFNPSIAVIEGTFYCRNVRTAMVLGMARGAAIAELARHGCTIYEYAPRKAKQTVCGHGAASKDAVAQVVAAALRLDVSDIPDDATDAMALAMCHIILLRTANGAYLPEPI